MDYQSTRNRSLRAAPPQAVLEGIAPDGGLYVAPGLAALAFDWRGALALPPLKLAAALLEALLPGYGDMAALVRRAYEGKFSAPELTPLAPAGEDYVLELFHGPTCAFKDVALSMLPQLITAARSALGVREEIAILTATSGDTGKAALEGFCDVAGTRILVFYPDGGVSPVQQAQMATQRGSNVTVCAVRGNFDDCQSAVKEAFAAIRAGDLLAGQGVRLSSANSINIGRLAPQVVYYFLAYAALARQGALSVGDAVDFCVPTGNFGDILAGYYAKLLGLPVERLVCASNANNVLTDFLATGVYDRRRPFHRTSSPSMDILVSSNLERLLYLAAGSEEKVAGWMRSLDETGSYTVDAATLAAIQSVFSAGCCDEAATQAAIGRVWRERGYLCDPHTAVAFAVAEEYKRRERFGHPLVILSTASPFKFPAAVLRGLGAQAQGDEFAQMEQLSTLTGAPVPPPLASLQSRAIRHRDVIDRADILPYILRRLGREESPSCV